MRALHKTLDDSGYWKQTSDPSATSANQTDSPARQREVYQERVYFHDFVQKFLYPDKSDGADGDTVWRNDDYTQLIATIRNGKNPFQLDFAIRRLTLNAFQAGVAIISLELEHTPSKDTPLTLAMVQNAIDQLRRSFTPFWDKDGRPGRVPLEVKIKDKAGQSTTAMPLDWPDTRTAGPSPLSNIPNDDPRAVFGHWRKLIEPLVISRMAAAKDAGNGLVWRGPTDERTPVNSFIWLKPESHMPGDTAPPPTQQALLAIRDSDWARLADAEESGGALHPYNADFVRKEILSRAFYDRFLPSPGAVDYIATRYITYGSHFSMVGASGADWEATATGHFRQHYASLTMIVRLEQAALLGLSRRLTHLVHSTRQDQTKREAGIIDLQDQFLEFTHRYRFTGVSSQVMPTELLTHLRDAAGVEVLYDEVRAEIDSAAAAVTAHQNKRANDHAARLNGIAVAGVGAGLVVGLMGSGWQMEAGEWFDAATPGSTLLKLSGVSAIAMSLIGLGGLCLSRSKNMLNGGLAWIAVVGVLLLVAGHLSG